MEENVKIQDGGNKTPSILKLNKLHVLLHLSIKELQVNILWYVKNIFCFYVLYSFTCTFFRFYIGLILTRTVVVDQTGVA